MSSTTKPIGTQSPTQKVLTPVRRGGVLHPGKPNVKVKPKPRTVARAPILTRKTPPSNDIEMGMGAAKRQKTSKSLESLFSDAEEKRQKLSTIETRKVELSNDIEDQGNSDKFEAALAFVKAYSSKGESQVEKRRKLFQLKELFGGCESSSSEEDEDAMDTSFHQPDAWNSFSDALLQDPDSILLYEKALVEAEKEDGEWSEEEQQVDPEESGETICAMCEEGAGHFGSAHTCGCECHKKAEGFTTTCDWTGYSTGDESDGEMCEWCGKEYEDGVLACKECKNCRECNEHCTSEGSCISEAALIEPVLDRDGNIEVTVEEQEEEFEVEEEEEERFSMQMVKETFDFFENLKTGVLNWNETVRTINKSHNPNPDGSSKIRVLPFLLPRLVVRVETHALMFSEEDVNDFDEVEKELERLIEIIQEDIQNYANRVFEPFVKMNADIDDFLMYTQNSFVDEEYNTHSNGIEFPEINPRWNTEIWPDDIFDELQDSFGNDEEFLEYISEIMPEEYNAWENENDISKGERATLNEMREEQKKTDLVIGEMRMKTLIDEIAQEHEDVNFTDNAYKAIQTAAEEMLIEIFDFSTNEAISNDREEINRKDFKLAVKAANIDTR
jgi:histone H3/H4